MRRKSMSRAMRLAGPHELEAEEHAFTASKQHIHGVNNHVHVRPKECGRLLTSTRHKALQKLNRREMRCSLFHDRA